MFFDLIKKAQEINVDPVFFLFPPFHAWCRCSFVPHVEDWDKWMDEYVEKHEKNEIETVKIKQSFLNEREESPRKMKEGDYAVDWSIIQSDEYESRLSKLSENKKVIQSIKTRCKCMLNNKDGLNTEEMYAIDLDSGKEIARITNQNLPFGIKRDDTFTARLNEADKQNVRILLMHNHPRGMPPSIEDINELFKNQNVCGITIGHDGSLYYYTKPNNKIDSSEYWVASKKYSRYNEYTGIEKAIEDLSKKYDFSFTILYGGIIVMNNEDYIVNDRLQVEIFEMMQKMTDAEFEEYLKTIYKHDD